MLRDLIRQTVDTEDDMRIVGEREVADASTILASDPQFVILGMDETTLPPVGTALLEELCSVRVLGLSAAGRWGYLHELHPNCTPVGEVSPSSLVALIRGGRRAEET